MATITCVSQKTDGAVPNVGFIDYSTKGEKIIVNNPTEFPGLVRTKRIEEPFLKECRSQQSVKSPDFETIV